MNTEILVCQPKPRPRDSWVPAARRAVEVKPGNHPRIERLIRVMPQFRPTPEHIAVLTAKYWGAKRVHLTVGFLDGPEPALRRRILLHMNARAKTANVQFVEAKTDPRMRIARVANIGYWSYVGTDLLSIQPSEQTMNLEGFTTQTDEKEFHRVVRHETGHTLGFPHEHMRAELVKKIDPKRAIEYFERTQGWSKEEVEQQVLIKIEDSSVRGTPHTEPNSIMCYQIPGFLTKDGKPISGGLDIDAMDYAFAAQLYPKPAKPAAVRKPSAAPRARRTVKSRARKPK